MSSGEREKKRRSIGGNLMVIVFCDGIKECSMCPRFTTISFGIPVFLVVALYGERESLLGVMMM